MARRELVAAQVHRHTLPLALAFNGQPVQRQRAVREPVHAPRLARGAGAVMRLLVQYELWYKLEGL